MMMIIIVIIIITVNDTEKYVLVNLKLQDTN